MAYELGSWGQMVDEIPSDPTSQLGLSRSLVWALKAFLKGTIGPGGSGVWTVVQSSDGAEADNTDRWGDTYTPGALICGAAGVAHSWIVLKAPASLSSSLYFLLDCSGSSNQIFMGYSYFSKMGFTGGDLKNRPTALDEVAGSTPSNICDSYTYTHRFNGILSARGDFVFMSFSLGRSLTYAAATLGVMEARPVDTWPFVFLAEAVGYIGTGYKHLINGCRWTFRLAGGVMPPTPMGVLLPQIWGTDMLGNGHPASGDYQTHLWPVFPAYIGAAHATYNCVKGRLPDMAAGYCYNYYDQGAQRPGTGAAEYTLIGGMWMPFTVSPTF